MLNDMTRLVIAHNVIIQKGSGVVLLPFNLGDIIPLVKDVDI